MSQEIQKTNSGLGKGVTELISKAEELALQKYVATPYSAEISRQNPTAFIFLIDQSGSMGFSDNSFKYRGHSMSKAEAVAFMVNTYLNEFINRCQKENTIKDLFDFCVIGYGSDDDEANIAWEGSLQNKVWVKPSELKLTAEYKTINLQKNIRGKISIEPVKVASWINSMAKGRTPMLSAISLATDLVKNWINDDHHDSYPPTIINITDGVATDGEYHELIEASEQLKLLGTNNGNVLFLNCHLGSESSFKCTFPETEEELPSDDNACLLYNMSSNMPEVYTLLINKTLNKTGLKSPKGFAYNADLKTLVNIMDIGTRKSTNVI
jgi:hypothetical protein